MTNTPPKALGYWFLLLTILVPVIAVIGALTRLTQSGLSMMEWDFHHFWWPSAGEIDAYYALYVEIPQYQITGFTREEFVMPVFWEWFHRNWARLIGVVALVGAIYFFARRQVPETLIFAVAFAPILIAIQGAVGWFMVYSGFNTVEDVSHYRLALHLGLAFFACGFFLVSALRVFVPNPEGDIPAEPWSFALVFVCLTLLFGVFVAGLNAADSSNTWPLFENGQFLPAAICGDEVSWRLECWINGKKGVHFIHRNVAMLAALLVLWAVFRTFMASEMRRDRLIAGAAGCVVLVQFFIGVSLVLAAGSIGEGARLASAVAHQIGALALLLLILTALYFRDRP